MERPMLKAWLNRLEQRIIDISGREHRAGFFFLGKPSDIDLFGISDGDHFQGQAL